MIKKVTKRMTSSNPKIAAIAWAEAGFKVLPIWGVKNSRCMCGIKNCGSEGKHPVGSLVLKGYKSATTNISKIKEWFNKYPTANYGIVLDNKLAVIDIDGKEGLEYLENKMRLPESFTVNTGRGKHLYFLSDKEYKKSLKEWPEIDFLTKGFVLGPGSTHISGKKYRVEKDVCRTITNLPDNIAPKGKKVKVNMSNSYLVKEGNRNNELFSIASALRFKGVSKFLSEDLLRFVNKRHCNNPVDNKELFKILNSAYSYSDDNKEIFSDLKDIQSKEIEWLWYPYIPKGEITILEGDPGSGKSYFTMALASIVSRGGFFPDNAQSSKGRVLIISAEDKPSTILRPRLESCGANINNIRVATERFTLDDRGLNILTDEVISYKPDLVIIDPLFAFVGNGIDMHRANEVTDMLSKIDKLAELHDVTILTVRHLNKGDGKSLYRGQGSIAITGTVRSVLALGVIPTDPHLKGIAHLKHNYSEEGRTILFSLEKIEDKIPTLKWEGFSELNATDLLGSPEMKSQDILQERLRNLLSNGRMSASEIEEEIEVSRSTLNRALKAIGAIQHGKGPRTTWMIP